MPWQKRGFTPLQRNWNKHVLGPAWMRTNNYGHWEWPIVSGHCCILSYICCFLEAPR